MSLRVLHVLDHSIPLHSGYAFRTLSLLREQRRLGWETYQLTSSKQGACRQAVETVDGWSFHRTPPVRGPGAGLPVVNQVHVMNALRRRLAEVIGEVKPDILHPHSPVLNALPALWAGRRFGIPVVYEMRASWEDAAVDHGSTAEGSLRYRLSRHLESFALHRADHVTTICEGLRSDIIARGVAADRVTIIPNAVDVERFKFCAAPDLALRRQLRLEDTVVLGFAGSFYGYEGLDLLLDAVPLLAQKYPKLRVLLVGGGPQADALQAQAHRLGIAERVVFTGRVPHGEVQRYYELIDVLIYPRRSMRLTEMVTPLKPLEAMAQGRLLVASDVGGHRELIRDGLTGVLFAAGDSGALAGAVERVLESPGEWPRMKAEGRRFVETERTWASSAAGYADVYRRLAPAGTVPHLAGQRG